MHAQGTHHQSQPRYYLIEVILLACMVKETFVAVCTTYDIIVIEPAYAYCLYHYMGVHGLHDALAGRTGSCFVSGVVSDIDTCRPDHDGGT